jgi:hypothetical protein
MRQQTSAARREPIDGYDNSNWYFELPDNRIGFKLFASVNPTWKSVRVRDITHCDITSATTQLHIINHIRRLPSIIIRKPGGIAIDELTITA